MRRRISLLFLPHADPYEDAPGSTLTGSAHPAIRLAPRISRVGVTSAEVPIWAGCLCSLIGVSSRVWRGNTLRGWKEH